MNNDKPGILVVDDNKFNRDPLKFNLTRNNHNLLVAESGAEALDIIARHEIDLILLDMMMPDMY